MDDRRARQAAEILWAARQEHRLLDALPASCRPESLADGYQVQAAMGDLCGAAIGWKIAATSAEGQRHIGVAEPLAGRLFAAFAHADGATLPAARLHMKVAEAEFAFRMGRNLPPRDSAYAVDEVMAAVAALHLAIEIPDSRFEQFVSAGAPQLVADDACAGWFVLGPEAAGWRALDLAAHAVGALRNGGVAGRGSGANVLGDPRLALAWIANDRANQGAGLKAGDIVTTGTCVKPIPVAPGDRIVADFGILGSVAVSFSQ